ncbi:MAG: LysR family transcriptional regulator [Candidatus Thiodiazotropha taylori]|nr:LysR family transcriptional regulator [Candidatus Thiodiazotropha taylori]
MDLIQRLVLFTDIVEKGSIAAAARSMGMTRSAISKQLAKLEQETAVRLLNRNTRSMSLTGPGRMLYEQAQRIRENQKETQALIAELSQQVSGELRITASMHFGRYLLPSAIRGFTERFPLVTPNLQLSDQASDIISENIDLAIRIGNLRDSRLVGRKLCGNPVVMVASPAFLSRHGNPSTIRELEHTPCVIYESDETRVDNWAYVEHGREQIVKVQSSFKTNDAQLLLDACVAGYGVALLPTYTVLDEIKNNKLRIVLPDIQLKDYQSIYLIYATRKHQPPALSEFLAYIQLWIQQRPIPLKEDLLSGT